ncbi:Hsp20/alpha crystallin family protein [bacterium]|nr:Hsp20/alpha crystallin family protein [bacterium]
MVKREDDNHIYYDIYISNLKETSVSTKVEKGYVVITGKTEKKSEKSDDKDDMKSKSVFSSTFRRSFPLPENILEEEMEVLPEEDKIVLKFPKFKNQ